MRSDGSAWLRHAFGLATMSWAFCLAACKNSPSVWIFTLQFDASELWKGFWFAHGFVTKRYKGIRMHHFSLRYMIYSITYISYVQIVWTRCASGFISSIGKKNMYRSDWPLRQWLQTPSVAICRTCLSSCTLAMLASSNSKCLCFSQRCLKRHPNWHWLHTHTHISIFTIYK